MSNKITANFGADVSEVEAKMIAATRATRAYERAVKSLDGKTLGPQDLTRSLSQSNEAMQKGLTLLRGGAVTAGVGMLLGQMKGFANAAKELGDNATEAQKSAAKWGDEFDKLGKAISGAGASVLGTLAQWGRDIGDSFRSPLEKSYEAVAESSEAMAERQEAALKRTKDAHAAAAAEIPKLRKKLAGEQRETRLSSLGEQGRAMTELYETEKAMAELAKQPKNAVNEARRVELLIELEQRTRKLAEINAKITEEEKRDATAAAEKLANQKAKLEEDVGDVVAMIADQQKKNDEEAIERAKELADERKKAFSETSAKNKAAFGQKLAAEGYDVGEDGKLRRGNVVVSAEDAARTMSTKDRNARLTAESKRDEIRNAGKIGQGGKTKTEEATLLTKIEAYLRPADLST